MRSIAIGWGRALALIASAVTFVSSVATAGELLVIPYSCRVVDGQPVLTPSDNQGYRVIGPREERDFTACSPANPDMCRRWKVYRFDVDCGGRRVPWSSVSAAADAHSGGRSWVEDGSLHIEMPPRWSMDPDDPCARRFRVGWRAGPMSRFCEERRAAARDDVVMPVGFAPMLELDGIFVADGAPSSVESGGVGPVARAEPPAPKPARVEAPAPKAAAEKSAKAPETPKPAAPVPAAAKPEPVPTLAPAEPVKRESSPPTRPAPSTTASAETPPAASTAAGAGTPAMPTIINQPGAQPTKAEPEKTATSPPETTAALADPKEAPVVVAMKDAADAPASATSPEKSPASSADDRDVSAVEVTILTTLTKSVSPTLLGIGGASMLALLALALAYRRNQAESGFTFARDIDTVDFDGRKGVRAGRWLTPQPRAERSPQPVSPYQQVQAKWSDAIPQSREEALEVLGMGVTRDVSDAAIKKIVDGLRLSWHPDYAKDPQDRELRELRMKQINAAWEIIVGKRPG